MSVMLSVIILLSMEKFLKRVEPSKSCDEQNQSKKHRKCSESSLKYGFSLKAIMCCVL
jgi:hypothetical protein